MKQYDHFSYNTCLLDKLEAEEAWLVIQMALAILIGSRSGADEAEYTILRGIGTQQNTLSISIALDWNSILDKLKNDLRHFCLNNSFDRIPLPSTSETLVSRNLSLRPNDPAKSILLVEARENCTWLDIENVVEQKLQNYSIILVWQNEKSHLDVFFRSGPGDVSSQIRSFGAQLESLTQQLAAIPAETTLLSSISIACEEDLTKIFTWNATVPKRSMACVHELIEAQAKAHSTAVAICAWDGELTYRQLVDLSDSLAKDLLKAGAGPGSVVPLFFDKSKWMPVAMLAVMKTGAACVALDTLQPQIRLKKIVDQVDAGVLLCSKGRELQAGNLTNAVVLSIGENMIRDGLAESELPVVENSSTVYISFTSGSTGTPKGAAISHSNFCSAVLHLGNYLSFGPEARVFDFAPYSFDLAWSNALHTLCGGGCLCIPAPEDCQLDLTGAIRKYDANLINITSSALCLIDPDRSGLRTVLLGGEPPAPDIVKTWAPKVRLLNTYGSAECPSKCTVKVLGERVEDSISMGFGLS